MQETSREAGIFNKELAEVLFGRAQWAQYTPGIELFIFLLEPDEGEGFLKITWKDSLSFSIRMEYYLQNTGFHITLEMTANLCIALDVKNLYFSVSSGKCSPPVFSKFNLHFYWGCADYES